MNPKHKEHIILIPVYNDWASLSQLIKNIYQQFSEHKLERPFLLIVNDGSTQLFRKELLPDIAADFQILHLHRNLGHQKAIATGLGYAHEHFDFNNLVIMDADGEDDPRYIMQLLSCSAASPGKIVLARRIKRKEGISFRLLYHLYKLFFYFLTGKKMAFGNFCLMSSTHVHQLVYYSEIWNNIAGGIIKSGLEYTSVPIPKGQRYEGVSKMNLTSLIIHGLSTISVFIEPISVRLLVFSFAIIIISAFSIAVIAGIKLFTPFAISGWASILASSMLIILLQSFLISLVMIVIYLSSQSQRKLIPALHYIDYLINSEKTANG